jgi:hypothetical protein
VAADRPPFIDDAIVNWLFTVFPDRCPSESDTERAIWMAVGAQKVIKKLRKTAESQSVGNVLHD